MPTGVATAITGKSIVFKVGTKDLSCQVTDLKIDQKSDSDTIETLGCRAVISKGLETEVSGSALYDGSDKAATPIGIGGAYKLLYDALLAGTALAIEIDGAGGEKWAATSAVLTELSVDIKADDVITFDFSLAVSDLAFTPPTAP